MVYYIDGSVRMLLLMNFMKEPYHASVLLRLDGQSSDDLILAPEQCGVVWDVETANSDQSNHGEE